MARKKKPTVWCKPLVGSHYYTVELDDEDNCEDLKGCEGVCLWESTRIVINRDLSDERKEHILAHELFGHAVLEAYGIDTSAQEQLGLTKSQWSKFEEYLASTYAPALLATLKSNGWVKLPKLPGRKTKARDTRTGAAKPRKRTARK